jgi:hypothetical protein
MQPELIDEWTFPSPDVEGLAFRVIVEHDPYVTPDEYGEGSAFDDPEIRKGWENDDWCFTCVEVIPEYKGIELTEATNGLGAVVWGWFAGVNIGREDFQNSHPLPDYIIPEVMHNLREHVSRKAVRARKRDVFKTWRARRWAIKQDARKLQELRKAL